MSKIYICFGFLVLIAIMLLLNNWQSRDWQKTIFQNTLSELKTVNPGGLPGFSSTSSDYEEFASSDGKFKIKYPASWLIVENQGLLTASAPKEWQEKYNLKTLFLAQYFKADKFAQLMVQEGVFDIPAEDIIEEMKKINQKQDLNMEIVKSDIQDNKTVFEARYFIPNSSNLYSKEEILSIGEKTYLIALIALEKDWQGFNEEIDFIFNSAQIVR